MDLLVYLPSLLRRNSEVGRYRRLRKGEGIIEAAVVSFSSSYFEMKKKQSLVNNIEGWKLSESALYTNKGSNLSESRQERFSAVKFQVRYLV